MWLVNLLLPVIYSWNRKAYYQLVDVAICFYLLISTLSYISIYRIVRQHQIHIRTQQLAVPANLGNELNFARLRRSAANTFIFYIFIILCYSPVFIEMTIPLSESRENPRGFGATAVFMNSSINPILYSWRLLEFRKAVVELARFEIVRKQFY